MTGDRQILAIDVGTQSVRALRLRSAGALLASARIPIEPYVSPQPGWAEQDPELYWRTLGEACRRVLADPAVRRDAIAGLAITTQRGTVVVTDEAGAPLRPGDRLARPAPDGGAAARRRSDRPGLPRARPARDDRAASPPTARRTGCAPTSPDTWRAIRHYLGLSGFLLHRLTGRFVDSTAAQVGYLPFDYKRFRWAADGDWKWEVAPVERAWLPELVPPTAALGELTAAAAEATGLPAGLPVIAAAADKACEVLGSGALTPDVASLSYGTTATVNTTSRRYIEPIRMIPPYPAAIPGAWTLEIQVYRGYWMVEWFKREFGDREVARAAATRRRARGPVRRPGPRGAGRIDGSRSCSRTGRPACASRAGGEGRDHRLRRRPHPRAPLPGDPRGAGLRAARRRRADGRADGRAADLAADRGRRVAEPGGGPADRRHLRAAGGQVHTHETSGLGAAIDAAVGLGLHPDVRDGGRRRWCASARSAIRTPPRTRSTTSCIATSTGGCIARLQPLYRSIRRITGYPPA